MPLVKCRDCGNQISSSAPACPRCGKPQRKAQSSIGCGGAAVVVTIFFAICAAIAQSDACRPVAGLAIPTAPSVPPTSTASATSKNEPSHIALPLLTQTNTSAPSAIAASPPQPPLLTPKAENPSPTAIPARINPLDRYIQYTQARGVTVIDRYYVDDGILYIELNQETWEGMTKEQEHRLCEALAKTNFIDEMHVPSAYLTLDHGATTIGVIAHGLLDPSCYFEADKDYWEYK